MMAAYWTNFAKSGDPNGPKLPAWPAFEASGDRVLLLDEPIRTGPVPNLPSLLVFDAVYDQIRGRPFGTR
jgi:para-nitrobenzyl esterase